MGVQIGGVPATDFRAGDQPLTALYAGSNKVWEPAGGGYEFGGTPFDPVVLTNGRVSYATITQKTTEKGFGAEINNSQYLQGYANVMTDGPILDFTKPWGFQFWLNIHPSANLDVQNYVMVIINSTTRNSTADRKWWTLYIEQQSDGSGLVGLQHTATLSGQPTTQSIGSLGLFTPGKWYLVSLDVGAVSGTAWSDIYVRADDLAGDVREITFPGPMSLLTALLGGGPLGLQLGVPMYAEPAMSFVPVAWKGTPA